MNINFEDSKGNLFDCYESNKEMNKMKHKYSYQIHCFYIELCLMIIVLQLQNFQLEENNFSKQLNPNNLYNKYKIIDRI